MDEDYGLVGAAFSHLIGSRQKHLCHTISTIFKWLCHLLIVSVVRDSLTSITPGCNSVTYLVSTVYIRFSCACVYVHVCTKCSDLVQVGQRETVMLKAFTSICCLACSNTHIYTQTHHRDGLSASKARPLSFKRYTLWPQTHSALGFLHGICLPAPGAKAGGRGRGLGPR